MRAVIQCGCFAVVLIAGALLKKKLACGAQLQSLVTKLVMWLILPCSIIAGYSEFQIGAEMLPVAIASLVANGILILVGSQIGKTFDSRFENLLLFSGYNTGSIALPFAQTFFGSTGVVATCVFDAVNAVFCCGGSYALASAMFGKGGKNRLAVFLKSLLTSHIFLIYMLMLALNLLNIHLPKAIVSFAGMISPATGYLAMLMIGLGFDREFRFLAIRTVTKPIALRYLVCGAMALAAVLLPLDLSAAMRAILAVNLLAPFTILSPAYIQKSGYSIEHASLAISVSSFVSVVLLSAICLSCAAVGIA